MAAKKKTKKVKAWAVVYGDNWEGICSHEHEFKDKIGFCLNITASKLVANVIASGHSWRVVPVTITYENPAQNITIKE
mgnify:CR=1 FL=1